MKSLLLNQDGSVLTQVIVFEASTVPSPGTLDRHLWHHWNEYSINMETQISELTLNNGDAPVFAGFDLHRGPCYVRIKFFQQSLDVCHGWGKGGHVIHIGMDRR